MSEQQFYTSSRRRRDGRRGFGVKAQSPGLAASDASVLETNGARFALPYNSDTSRHDALPTAFSFYRVRDGLWAVTRTLYAGIDDAGRPGNYFAHSITLDDAEMRAIEYTPARLYSAEFWVDNEADAVARGLLRDDTGAPNPDGGNLNALPLEIFQDVFSSQERTEQNSWNEARSFLANEKRQKQFTPLLSAALQIDTTRRRVILVDEEANAAASWVNALCCVLPRVLRPLLTFSTYQRAPHRTGFAVTATTAQGEFAFTQGAYQSESAVFHFGTDRFTQNIPISPMAQALTQALLTGNTATLEEWDKQARRFDITELSGLEKIASLVQTAVARSQVLNGDKAAFPETQTVVSVLNELRERSKNPYPPIMELAKEASLWLKAARQAENDVVLEDAWRLYCYLAEQHEVARAAFLRDVEAWLTDGQKTAFVATLLEAGKFIGTLPYLRDAVQNAMPPSRLWVGLQDIAPQENARVALLLEAEPDVFVASLARHISGVEDHDAEQLWNVLLPSDASPTPEHLRFGFAVFEGVALAQSLHPSREAKKLPDLLRARLIDFLLQRDCSLNDALCQGAASACLANLRLAIALDETPDFRTRLTEDAFNQLQQAMVYTGLWGEYLPHVLEVLPQTSPLLDTLLPSSNAPQTEQNAVARALLKAVPLPLTIRQKLREARWYKLRECLWKIALEKKRVLELLKDELTDPVPVSAEEKIDLLSNILDALRAAACAGIGIVAPMASQETRKEGYGVSPEAVREQWKNLKALLKAHLTDNEAKELERHRMRLDMAWEWDMRAAPELRYLLKQVCTSEEARRLTPNRVLLIHALTTIEAEVNKQGYKLVLARPLLNEVLKQVEKSKALDVSLISAQDYAEFVRTIFQWVVDNGEAPLTERPEHWIKLLLPQGAAAPERFHDFVEHAAFFLMHGNQRGINYVAPEQGVTRYAAAILLVIGERQSYKIADVDHIKPILIQLRRTETREQVYKNVESEVSRLSQAQQSAATDWLNQIRALRFGSDIPPEPTKRTTMGVITFPNFSSR